MAVTLLLLACLIVLIMVALATPTDSRDNPLLYFLIAFTLAMLIASRPG